MVSVVPILAMNTLVALVLAAVVVRQRDKAPARPFLLALTTIIIWMAGYAAELSAAALSSRLFWANIQFIGIGLAPVAWLETIRRMVGRPAMGPAGIVLHAVVPAVAVVLAFTSDAHEIFRGSPSLYRSMGMLLLDADYQWFHNLVFVPYQYAIYLAGLVIILESMADAHRHFRRGYMLLIAGMTLPWVGGVLYVLSVPPFVNFNPTSLFVLATLVVYLVVLFREDMLDLTPIGRPQIMENLQEGVVVLDTRGRIVDLNPTAVSLLPQLRAHAGAETPIGAPLRDLVAGNVPLVLMADGIERSENAFETEVDGETRYYLVRPTELVDSAGGARGRALSILDITTATRLVHSLQVEQAHRETLAPHPLLNRREFLRRLDHEVQRAGVFQRALSIALLQVEAGEPKAFREELEQQLRRRCDEMFWMAWMSPVELAVLVPEWDQQRIEECIVAALPDHVVLSGVYHEVARPGRTREGFLADAHRHMT